MRLQVIGSFHAEFKMVNLEIHHFWKEIFNFQTVLEKKLDLKLLKLAVFFGDLILLSLDE